MKVKLIKKVCINAVKFSEIGENFHEIDETF